jgi:hypothetical protein
MLDGIEHINAATVIEVCESAETVPVAELFSMAGLGAHVPSPTSPAEPPAELRPCLP